MSSFFVSNTSGFDSSRYYADKSFLPRGHQRDFIKWIEKDYLLAGKRFCGLYATPGAGKSGLPLILGQLIETGDIDFIVWVGPRGNLKKQGADSFTADKRWCPRYKAKEVTKNEPPLLNKGEVKDGWRCLTVTYQGVAANPELWIHWFEKHRVALVLDEVHHLCDDEGSIWLNSIAPLKDMATLTLAMTGTVERHDNKMLPFFSYTEENVLGRTRFFVKPDISYSRSDALREKAKLPIEFTLSGGWANFVDEDGEKDMDISSCEKQYESKVIRSILNSGKFVESVLTQSLNHFLLYRDEGYKEAKYIGVFHSQSKAHKIKNFIQKEYPSLRVGVATSTPKNFGEMLKGNEAIEKFRKKNIEHGSFDVLLTVGMAYEGLDVPSATHLACLTQTRSKSWIEQCVDRITRVNYEVVKNGIPYDAQQGFVWAPNDPRMQRIIEYIQAEQQKGIQERGGDGPGGPAPTEEMFIPLDSEKGEDYMADQERFYGREESVLVASMRKSYPILAGLTPKMILELADQGVRPKSSNQAVAQMERNQTKLRRNQKEYYMERSDGRKLLNKEILSICGKLDHAKGLEFGTTSISLGSRKNMGVSDLWEIRTKLTQEWATVKGYKG